MNLSKTIIFIFIFSFLILPEIIMADTVDPSSYYIPERGSNSLYSGKVNYNDSRTKPTIDEAKSTVYSAFFSNFGREPNEGESDIYVNYIMDNQGFPEEIENIIAKDAELSAGLEDDRIDPWPITSTDASSDGLNAVFTRSGSKKTEEDRNTSYNCAQDDPDDPTADIGGAIGAIDDAIMGSGTVGGVFGEGPMSGISFSWTVTGPEGNLGGGSGADFSFNFKDPTEPRKAKVTNKINYQYKKFFLFGK